MKKTLKRISIIVLAMAMTVSAAASFAEEIAAEAAAPAPAPVVEEKKEESAPAPAAEEKKEEVTEAPAAETPAPAAEAPATEAPATEAPAIEGPATEAPATEAPATEEPTAEPTPEATEEAPVAFTGSVEVKLENEGEIFFGDTVVLRAEVRDANTAYEIRWEVKKDCDCEVIGGEDESIYKFVVTEENAAYEYRAVLITEA